MNTIIKTGTATTTLLLALSMAACGNDTATGDHPKLVPGAGPAGAVPVPGSTPALHRTRMCTLSPDAIERWTRDGEPLPCVVARNRSARHYGDDHRAHIG